MCSILGIGLFNNHKLRDDDTLMGIFSRLIKEGEVGGRRASGVSIMRDKKAHVLRRPLGASQLVATEEYLKFMEDNIDTNNTENALRSIVGHCRAPTQGSPQNNLNNHPIVAGNIIGVHNGIIGNDHTLFTQFEKIIKRSAEVDSEIIFRLLEHFTHPVRAKTVDAIKTAAPYLAGSYACAVHNTKHPYNLYLFRHSCPINIRYFPEHGVVLFATRMHYIERALENFFDDMGEGEDIDLVDNSGVVFNLHYNTMSKFRFSDKREAEEKKNATK